MPGDYMKRLLPFATMISLAACAHQVSYVAGSPSSAVMPTR